MHVSIETAGDGEAAALYGWLRRDRDLARCADVVGGGRADPTSMSALEVIDVVLTHVTGIATLALSVFAWWQSRPRSAPVTIIRPDGRRLTVGGDPAVTAEVIVAFLTDSDSGSDPVQIVDRPGTNEVGLAASGE
jgi:hypothetical protein